MTISREQAAQIATAAAKAEGPHRPPYYTEPFKPHEWVIDAILAARKPLESEIHDQDILNCSLKLDEAMHRAQLNDLTERTAELQAKLDQRTQECISANERLQEALKWLRVARVSREVRDERAFQPDAVLDGPISSDGSDKILEGVTDAARHYRTLYRSSLEELNKAGDQLRVLQAKEDNLERALGWVMRNWSIMIERKPINHFDVPIAYLEIMRHMRAKVWGLNYVD